MTNALRDRVVESGTGGEIVGQSDHQFGPADAPRRVGAIPPDPAISIAELNQGLVRMRRWGGHDGQGEKADRACQIIHHETP